MNKEKVQELLKALGGTVTASTNKWVTCTCVMARWSHTGGVDNHPSSGMTIKDDGESFYNCYTCKSKGNAYEIYKKVKMMANANGGAKQLGINLPKAMDIINMDSSDDFLLSMPDYESELVKEPNAIYDFSELTFSNFTEAYEHPYTVYREIPYYLAKKIDIRLDEERNRIVFPIRDWEGVLVGMHGRTFLEDVEPRYYSYPNQDGKRNPDVWMGEDHVDLDEPVILVEGQFDYAKIRQHYDNVLSGQTANIQEDKLKRISVASEVITMFDRGQGGDDGRQAVNKYFTKIPVTHIEPPEPWGDIGETPDHVIGQMIYSILTNK